MWQNGGYSKDKNKLQEWIVVGMYKIEWMYKIVGDKIACQPVEWPDRPYNRVKIFVLTKIVKGSYWFLI